MARPSSSLHQPSVRPATASGPAPVRRRLDPETRRTQLLDVLRETIVDRGELTFTMELLARRAGVNKALLYHYFGSRDGMLVALYERTWRKMQEAVVAAVAAGDTLESRLRNFALVWLNNSEINSTVSALFATKRDSDALEQAEMSHAAESVEYLAHVLSMDDDLDPTEARLTAATLLTGGHYGFTPTYLLFGLDAETAADLFVRICLGAVTNLRRVSRP